jgi:hypothetical protein
LGLNKLLGSLCVRSFAPLQSSQGPRAPRVGELEKLLRSIGVSPVLRIIDRHRVTRAEVQNVVTALPEQLRDAVLVFEAGMIGAKGYFHGRIERPRPMKLACASSSLHRDIERGELTQLEFLDLCARELACDGVVLDVRHFPRTDDDYLAQVKKMAVDRGLTIAGLADISFFCAPPERMGSVLDHAVTLGAPLVAGPLAREVECSWTEQLARLNVATSLAKAHNVTLALRNAPGTFAANAPDCKRVVKETDSAWLRFGPQPQRLDAASEPQALAANTILIWSDVSLETDRSMREVLAAFANFRGHVVLDQSSPTAGTEQLAASLRRWQTAVLNHR